jgi:hypothetical protein
LQLFEIQREEVGPRDKISMGRTYFLSLLMLTAHVSSQLENRLGGEERFQERVTKYLVPCIAQFSVAMADDSMWKPLNYQILLKTRDSSPKVSTGSQSQMPHSPGGCCLNAHLES